VLVKPLRAELNPIRHLLTLVGARLIVHVRRVRVNFEYTSGEVRDTITKQVTSK
jgi:hypothetical protein